MLLYAATKLPDVNVSREKFSQHLATRSFCFWHRSVVATGWRVAAAVTSVEDARFGSEATFGGAAFYHATSAGGGLAAVDTGTSHHGMNPHVFGSGSQFGDDSWSRGDCDFVSSGDHCGVGGRAGWVKSTS